MNGAVVTAATAVVAINAQGLPIFDEDFAIELTDAETS
jgi:hypothetical protein